MRDEPHVAHATAAVVTEILDVLVDNAHRHGAGTVGIGVRDEGRWLAVDVADEGGGFGDDAQDVFERRQPTGDGHGIGLPLARALAHAEAGRLTITQASPPVVTLWLPREPSAPGPPRSTVCPASL
jgi:signal transduction histidine kinase